MFACARANKYIHCLSIHSWPFRDHEMYLKLIYQCDIDMSPIGNSLTSFIFSWGHACLSLFRSFHVSHWHSTKLGQRTLWGNIYDGSKQNSEAWMALTFTSWLQTFVLCQRRTWKLLNKFQTSISMETL